jgi:hypothetical protein
MRPAQFRRHFSNAIRLSGVTCTEDEFRKDLTESTSLAVIDGPYIRFCHLSFHEYFSAAFLSEVDDNSAAKLIQEFSEKLETDNVLPLLLSMNKAKIEKNWVIPKMNGVIEAIKATVHDIDRYADIVAAKANDELGSIAIANTMRQIRLLYKFSPSTQNLLVAYDAAFGMHIGVRKLTSRSISSKKSLFERDRQNFEVLHVKTIKEYREKSSALLDLIELMPAPTEPKVGQKRRASRTRRASNRAATK